MDQEKVGRFIKEIRKQNGLTQKEFADRLGVTYQAVSKWENGINLPEISLLKQISKEFNISIDKILDASNNQNNKKKNNLKKLLFIIIPSIIILLVLILFLFKKDNKDSFSFKTLSTNCEEFNVSGSIAYDKYKSSIYISNINYCGGNDDTIYKEIECNLYEKNSNTNIKISSCKSNDNNIKLEDYLKSVQLNIDNYIKTCNHYNDDSLYLEISATDINNKITTYKIPLSINNNCPENDSTNS